MNNTEQQYPFKTLNYVASVDLTRLPDPVSLAALVRGVGDLLRSGLTSKKLTTRDDKITKINANIEALYAGNVPGLRRSKNSEVSKIPHVIVTRATAIARRFVDEELKAGFMALPKNTRGTLTNWKKSEEYKSRQKALIASKLEKFPEIFSEAKKELDDMAASQRLLREQILNAAA